MANGQVSQEELDSLGALEQYLLTREGQDDRDVLLNRGARYLGEVFRKHLGGTWALSTEPKNLHFLLPVVTGFAEQRLEFCPIMLCRNFARQKKNGMFLRAIEANAPYAKKRPM